MLHIIPVTAAYKPGKKKSKSEQARNAGLGAAADQLVDGYQVDFRSFVGAHADLKSVKNVKENTKLKNKINMIASQA